MRILALAAAYSAAIGLAACATLTKGTTQQVAINTPGAPGAECTLTSGAIGTKIVTTPAAIILDKSQDAISVTCRKACFQDGVAIIASNTEAMSAGNIVFGGVVGLGVDAVSGAMNKYNADNQIAMVPIQGCRA
ncbi:MAG: hypothetical protein AB7J30_18980 [Hyphomicrobium sp.]|uniref:hypothetical protein n=1 Tax=Hyphomicrobium sp. TaxID=82 RepID=UPI003D0A74C1